MFTGNKDIDIKILLMLDDISLKNMLYVNKYIYSLINLSFWNNKIYNKFKITFSNIIIIKEEKNEKELYFKLKESINKIEKDSVLKELFYKHYDNIFNNFYIFNKIEQFIFDKEKYEELEKLLSQIWDEKIIKYFLNIVALKNGQRSDMDVSIYSENEQISICCMILELNYKTKLTRLLYKYLNDLDPNLEINGITNAFQVESLSGNILKNI
jgi:hypothetical protein